MKKKIITLLSLTFLAITAINAQEKHGRVLNLGFGAGYSGYYSNSRVFVSPGINLNYEFDIARNLTLAPSISASSYRSYRYWGDQNNPYNDYYYRQTNIPIGAKVSYYFDDLLRANEKWDFYVGTTAGFVYRTAVWDDGYNGQTDYYYASSSPVFVNMHIGSELHLTPKFGLFLDLSTGMSTFGLAFHF